VSSKAAVQGQDEPFASPCPGDVPLASCRYTDILRDIEAGNLAEWRRMPAPDIALKYWRLSPGATFEDVIKVRVVVKTP
jgi:hypothetical protein